MTDYSAWGMSELVEEFQRRDTQLTHLRSLAETIFGHMAEDERDHYEENDQEPGHIFETLRELSTVLKMPL